MNRSGCNEIPMTRQPANIVTASGNELHTAIEYPSGVRQQLACKEIGSEQMLAAALASCAFRSIFLLLERNDLPASSLQIGIARRGDAFLVKLEGLPADKTFHRKAAQAVRICPVAKQLRVAPIVEAS